MKKSPEELAGLLNAARTINLSEPVLFPAIERRIEERINLMCSEFRMGKNDNLVSHVGYITALKDLLNEFKRIKEDGNRAQIKLLDDHKN